MKLQTVPQKSPQKSPKQAPKIDNRRDNDAHLDKPWHVVLLDDNEHSYDYVVEMLMKLFGYSIEKAYGMAVEVDEKKRVIVKTCHREIAEFHQERIHEFGPDPYLENSRGSMQAVLQRAL